MWYELLWFMQFSKMSEYFQTCLNLLRFNMIWILTIHRILKHVWTCSNKHVQTCSGSIWYKLLLFIWFSNISEQVQTCLNLFRFNMIWIDTILKHVWTWNQNMMKYYKIWANGRRNVPWQSYSLDRCEQVERSKTHLSRPWLSRPS